jgi:hypothetical protein
MKGLEMTKATFEAEWWKLVQTGLGYIEAYRQLEEWHYTNFGKYRYSSYTSFANIRDRNK